MHDVAPVTTGGSDEIEVGRPNTLGAISRSQQKRMMSRWAGLWRSMILSSLDQTAFPYCRYIRALNLSDLIALLDDTKFSGEHRSAFFSGPLLQFRMEMETPMKERGKSKPEARLLSAAIQNAVGEILTQKTPMLEELRAEPTAEALLSWISRLPRLQSMTVWSGSALDNGIGVQLRDHCPLFKTLRVYQWPAPDADSLFSKFLTELRPQSLQSLEVFSHPSIEEHTLSALNCHANSLTELRLYNLKSEGMIALPMLKDCTALTTLLLAEIGFTDLKNRQNDVFLDTIAWLKNCKALRSISFQKIYSGPDILTPILMQDGIHLIELEVTDYPASKAKDFHQALKHQARSLRSLLLKGPGEDCDINVLVDSLACLDHLSTLRLRDVSDYFNNEHIRRLALSLPELESFWTSGFEINDTIWAEMAQLHNLRRLDITAWSAFTVDGILEYISNLAPGNRGLSLSIMMADPNSSIPEEGQTLIRDLLAAKVEGRFDYLLARGNISGMSHLKSITKLMADPEASESDESDSD